MRVFERLHMPSLGGATEWLNSEPLGPGVIGAPPRCYCRLWPARVVRVHDEPGVELYALHEGRDGLVMIEKYASEQARAEHSKRQALADLLASLKGKLSRDLDLQVLAPHAAGLRAPSRTRRSSKPTARGRGTRVRYSTCLRPDRQPSTADPMQRPSTGTCGDTGRGPLAGTSSHRGGIVMTAHWPVPAGLHTASVRLPVEGELPSFGGATGWLNSPPLTVAGLRGKVVLVDFWTYTCINWLRQLPYVRAWAGKYSGQGLVVVGVHTPEFAFEGNVENVSRAVREMRVGYPVAIDNDYAVWSAFDNHYWPAIYFADASGLIRHHHFGEGEYQQSEMVIQQLLAEAGSAGAGHELVSVDARGAEAPADWATLRSPENYTGYERTENFASPGGAVLGKRHAYTAPAELRLNHWALSGDWTMEEQATTLNTANGRIAYRFHARDLHLVMGPAVRGTSVRFRVLIDGQPPGAAHGTDVDDQGNGTVTQPRLYQLIRQRGPITDRTFEITFLDPGVQAYAFTFG